MMSGAVSRRVDWVDYGKGICIILVVMMHSTLGVEKVLGVTSGLHAFIEWARPFRMPDFFLISGLFLASRIDRPWRSYLDAKVVHFAYFYILWMTIAFALKGPGMMAEVGLSRTLEAYAMGFIEPWSTLWFIYLLAIFFVTAKLLRNVSPVLVWLAAAMLEIAPIETGWMVVDEFASRFVYFYTGYILATQVFRFADRVSAANALAVVAGLVLWATANGWLVNHGWAFFPGIGLVAGFVGAGAVVAVSTLLARSQVLKAVRYCGEHSLVIYLAFFVFMAASRSLLLKLGLENHPALVSLAVTFAGVVGPILLYWAVRRTPLKVLFERPALFRFKRRSAPRRLVPAE